MRWMCPSIFRFISANNDRGGARGGGARGVALLSGSVSHPPVVEHFMPVREF